MFKGIDLGSESIKVATGYLENDRCLNETFSLLPEGMEKFLKTLTKEDYVVVEASTNSFWFIEKIKDYVKECYVVNTWKFSSISNSNKKTDKIDAMKLMKKLKYYILFDRSEEEFPLVYVPSKEVQELRSIFSTYKLIQKEINSIKNRIRSLLRQFGYFGFKKQNISHYIVQEKILKLNMDDFLKFQIEILFKTLNEQEKTLKQIQNKILIKGVIFKEEIDILTSIKGISPFIAIAIMTDIVVIDRFKNPKHLCSYLRTAPRIDASGDFTKIGKVNKQSRKLTVSLICECINHFRSSSKKINDFYKRKTKGKTKGKARIAVMRKIIVAIYWMLKRKEYYYYIDTKNHDRKKMEYQRILKKSSL